MTLSQITYFRVLAETLHMRNAAEKLFISQPALSSSIAKLETELHVRLFERKGHRLLLTEAGEQFLVHAEKIHREVYEAGLHMERISQTANTKIRLGCITPVLRDDLPGSMRRIPGKRLPLSRSSDTRETLSWINTCGMLPKKRTWNSGLRPAEVRPNLPSPPWWNTVSVMRSSRFGNISRKPTIFLSVRCRPATITGTFF